jgi:putative ABC transport system permease protein
MVEGRPFRRGLNEVIVGRGAAAQFAGLEVGGEVLFGRTPWRVAGIFEDGGSVSESEIWTDATVLQGAYNRGSSVQSVRVRLPGPGELDGLVTASRGRPALQLHGAHRARVPGEPEPGAGDHRPHAGRADRAADGVGAVFAALNTMYSAVAARTPRDRDAACARLRRHAGGRLGAGRVAAARAAGRLLGGALAYVGFNGAQASTLNFQSFSQVAFAFTVTPALLFTGLGYALLLGLVGGLLPGLRAARMPVTVGLRQL